MSSLLPSSFDVIVVGSGAAGLYAALCLPSHYRVGLMTKDTLHTGASDWAQGGIAAAVDPMDSPKLHLQDTLHAGVELCDYSAVKLLVEKAPEAIKSLVGLGVAFDRSGEKLAMTLEAAHSRPRVLHAADTTGKAIIATLTAKVRERPNIEIIQQAIALNLWHNESNTHCQGISVLYHRQIHWIRAAAVILATGGGGQVYAQTTNPAVSTGDGVALAWRGGAIVRDLEFFQFHPTALTIPDAPRFLISEAVRGEGAYLIDDKGERFTFNYHPSGELAPRDVVSRAIFNHLQQTVCDPAQAHVYLDLSPIDPERIRRRFPNIIQVCHHYGVDVFTQPIPVAPAAHYWMGGVAVDTHSQTSLSGLYAIGETASTGVHGANRLASNSLLECIVFAGQLADLDIEAVEVAETVPSPLNVTHSWKKDEKELIQLMRQQLPALMWQNAGICRDEAGLTTAIAQVNQWRKELITTEMSQYLFDLSAGEGVIFTDEQGEIALRQTTEMMNLLDIAYLILKSALFRQESRGGHYRTDYRETLAFWEVHTMIQGDRWWTMPVH